MGHRRTVDRPLRPSPCPRSSAPTPSRSFTDSPFAEHTFMYCYLEDFEDDPLNTSGVRLREFATTNISTA